MTIAEPISMTDMISAAVVSSFLVFRIRPVGSAALSVASPLTRGMTTTPVSNPDRPSASAGKTSSEAPSTASGEAWAAVTASVQSVTVPGSCATCQNPLATTTTLRPM